MIDPKVHKEVRVHGLLDPSLLNDGKIHFSTDEAHIKEWPHLFRHHATNWTETVPAGKSIVLPAIDTVGKQAIHQFEEGHPDDPTKGYRTLYYDESLADWFAFVVSLASQKE